MERIGRFADNKKKKRRLITIIFIVSTRRRTNLTGDQASIQNINAATEKHRFVDSKKNTMWAPPARRGEATINLTGDETSIQSINVPIEKSGFINSEKKMERAGLTGDETLVQSINDSIEDPGFINSEKSRPNLTADQPSIQIINIPIEKPRSINSPRSGLASLHEDSPRSGPGSEAHLRAEKSSWQSPDDVRVKPASFKNNYLPKEKTICLRNLPVNIKRMDIELLLMTAINYNQFRDRISLIIQIMEGTGHYKNSCYCFILLNSTEECYEAIKRLDKYYFIRDNSNIPRYYKKNLYYSHRDREPYILLCGMLWRNKYKSGIVALSRHIVPRKVSDDNKKIKLSDQQSTEYKQMGSTNTCSPDGLSSDPTNATISELRHDPKPNMSVIGFTKPKLKTQQSRKDDLIGSHTISSRSAPKDLDEYRTSRDYRNTRYLDPIKDRSLILPADKSCDVGEAHTSSGRSPDDYY